MQSHKKHYRVFYCILHCHVPPHFLSSSFVPPPSLFSLQQEYREWVLGDRRSIVAVLEDLTSFQPPLDHLVELLPRLQARYYSISSSSKVQCIDVSLDFCLGLVVVFAN